MPGNFRTNLIPYQNDIPDICFSQVTAALKARFQLGRYIYVYRMQYFMVKTFEFHVSIDGSKTCMVATATSQGNLLIFHQRKLLKSCQLPFSDCCEILLYHSCQPRVTKEYLVAISFTKGGVVVDLQQSSVS